MRTTYAIALLALLALFATTSPATASAQDVAEGRAAIERFGCVSCHAIPGVEANARTGCVSCHQQLERRATSAFQRGPRAQHFLATPDLGFVTRRLEREYLVRFLMDPHDVRPELGESMPRLPVTERDARAIVAYLTDKARHGARAIPSSPAPNRSNVARGRAVFASAGCGGCHALGNADPGFELPEPARRALGAQYRLAPNLRFVRDRMSPDAALAWILDPTSIDPRAHMPKPEISRDDAIAVRDYLFFASPGAAASAPRVPRAADLAPLDRQVRFADVRRVFAQSCIHCHAHTTNAGTTTGLGFSATALDLSTAAGVRAGALRADGTRVSILEPGAGGSLAPLVARLVRRHEEARRDVMPRRRDTLDPAIRPERDAAPVGMPLGLPPVSRDDIRLVATWIAQGARD